MPKDVSAVDLNNVFVKDTATLWFQVPVNTEYNGIMRFTNIDLNPGDPDSAAHSITVFVKDSAAGAPTDIHTVCPSKGIQGGNGFDFGPSILAAGRKVFLQGDVDDKITARFEGYKTVTS